LVHYLTDIRLVLSLIFGAIHQLRKYLCTKKQLTSVVGRTLPFRHSSAKTGNCQADSEDTLAKLGNILLYMVIFSQLFGHLPWLSSIYMHFCAKDISQTLYSHK
jgi:hypothetical protein